MRKYLRHKVKIYKWSSGSWYMVPATFLPKQMQLRFFAKASGHLRSYGKGCPPGTTKRWENFPTFRFFCFSIDLPTLIALRHSTFDSVLKACRKSKHSKKNLSKNHSKKISCLSAEFKKTTPMMIGFWVGPLPCPLPCHRVRRARHLRPIVIPGGFAALKPQSWRRFFSDEFLGMFFVSQKKKGGAT